MNRRMRQPRPNLLFVLADQLRGCSVGYAGEEAVRTPNLDAFAATGTICANAISMLPVCGPYRGSLLTGRAPTSTGLVINDVALKTTETGIAHCFKAGGYDTAYIGKWHLDGPDRPAPVPPGPRRQGFEYWVAANFEHNYDRSFYTDNAGDLKIWPGWDAEAQTTHAIDYLQGRESDNPFCLFLSWGPPHHPYRLVPQDYLDMYDPTAIEGRPNCPDVPRDDLWGYYAQTTFLDDQFQRLLDALDDIGHRRRDHCRVQLRPRRHARFPRRLQEAVAVERGPQGAVRPPLSGCRASVGPRGGTAQCHRRHADPCSGSPACRSRIR